MFRIFLILILAGSTVFAQQIEIKRLNKHVKYLASDRLEGRGTGTIGEKKAGDYIIKNFKKAGIKPYLNDYRQPFMAHKGDRGMVPSNNILGYIDNGKPYTVIIGAHYDHLGLGDQGSSLKANSEGEIHNGADDNASGVATMLELARYYSKNKKTEEFNFLFAAFSGEELGLLGSKYMVDNTDLDPKNINLMINMDMVGRYREDKGLTIGGIGTSSVLEKLAPELGDELGLKYHLDSAGVGPSDHASFYLRDMPVVFLFTGAHEDYHKPGDDAHLINYEGMKTVSDYVIGLVERLEDMPKIDFKKAAAPQTQSTRTSFKVTMGVIPDYASSGTGLKIDGVLEGHAAEKAGIQTGDIVLKIGDKEIKDIYNYMEVLQESEKGDTVDVVVDRKGEKITLKLTF